MTICFEYDESKATQVILWLLQRHGGKLDKVKLVKLIFFADITHLGRYGRPVVGGRYLAMDHGPVSSEILDHIKRSKGGGRAQPFVLKGYKVIAQGLADEDKLSQSDMEILEEINDEYGARDTFSLRDETHRYEAWKEHYRGRRTSRPIPYEAFFLDLPKEEQEMLAVIREDQEARDILAD